MLAVFSRISATISNTTTSNSASEKRAKYARGGVA
jgi:hypothetical protein